MVMQQDLGDGISVCMATYNGAAFLGPQIDSILSQLRDGDELLISDDGSTDDTPRILASYASALRVVSGARVGGVVPNFSRVLAHASKPLVVLADQDDVWLPQRLQHIRESLARCDLLLTNAIVTDGVLEPTGATLFDARNSGVGFWRNLRRNSFVGCCMGFRRSLLVKALPLPAGTPWHDWLLGLLASVGGAVEISTTPLLLYRRHGANVSQTGQVSGNSLGRMVALRARVLYAVGFCLVRHGWRRLSVRDGGNAS